MEPLFQSFFEASTNVKRGTSYWLKASAISPSALSSFLGDDSILLTSTAAFESVDNHLYSKGPDMCKKSVVLQFTLPSLPAT